MSKTKSKKSQSKKQEKSQKSKKVVKEVAAQAKDHQMIKDKLFLWLVIINLALLIGFVINLLIRIRPQDFAANIRYSSLEGFDSGDWKLNFDFLVFAVLANVFNLFIAAKVFRKSRVGTFLILFGTVLINVFTIIVGNLVISSSGLL